MSEISVAPEVSPVQTKPVWNPTVIGAVEMTLDERKGLIMRQAQRWLLFFLLAIVPVPHAAFAHSSVSHRYNPHAVSDAKVHGTDNCAKDRDTRTSSNQVPPERTQTESPTLQKR